MKIFISHASKDKPEARKLRHLLIEESALRNPKVFLDEASIEPGKSIVKRISDELGSADFVLLLWTSAAKASSWTEAEWQSALMSEFAGEGTILLTLWADETPLPQILKHRLAFDMRKGVSAGFDGLARFLEKQEKSVLRATSDESDQIGEEQTCGRSCLDTLGSATHVELRRSMGKRLSRTEVATVWFDAFGDRMDDVLPGKSKSECILELLLRAGQKSKLDEVIDSLCYDHPQIQDDIR